MSVFVRNLVVDTNVIGTAERAAEQVARSIKRKPRDRGVVQVAGERIRWSTVDAFTQGDFHHDATR